MGSIDDPLAGRIDPGGRSNGGRGLWLANQLRDLIQIRSHPGGSTVRAHLAISSGAAPTATAALRPL